MKTRLFLLTTLCQLLFFFGSYAQTITLIESGGWFETAYVKWSPVSGADSYNVYYSGNGISNQQIDEQLIRQYGSYFRADVPGLAAGNYTLTVKPVISGSEGSGSTTSSITVQAHDRTGFAFSNGRVPGAYNANGTPKSGAVILYITENTKNTISLDVTGANSNPCVGLQEILEGFKKGNDTRPLIVRFVGQITDFSYMLNGDIVVENKNNASSYITLEGIGDDATADGWGIRIKNASNIEIRNIGTMNCDSGEGDNIGLQQNNDYIWVHNCDFFYGDAGGDSDQAKGDGALDCKKSTYVTFSYNHFWDAGKSNLLGLSEGTTSGLYITYHHNWYDHSDSRHPRVRYYSAHVYNNYYDGNAKYGVGSTMGSSVFVEGNYFRNCKYPMLISEQGTDVYGSNDGTFSSEDGGIIKAYNNYISGENRFAPYGNANYTNSTTQFDAYVASSRNETVGSSVQSYQGSNTYNNFDTNSSIMYSYTPDSPENARTNVMNYAGRMDGGDFSWTFNNSVDDTSYDVNTGLKSALTSYSTSLVAVQGEGGVVTNPSGYTLTTAVSGSGTVSGGGSYDDGTTVTITATPASGWSFSNWTGDASGSSASTTVLMDADKSVTAVFTQDGGGPVTGSSYDHNFTTDGLSSSFYNISGNLSTSKGTVTYAGMTLTQCLKIESSTSIGFTSSQEGTLTLVFNDGYSGDIKIDGTSQAASNGVLTTTLAAGSHTITKDDVCNIYYMSLATDGGGSTTTTYTLTTVVNGQGTVSPDGGTFDEGTSVTITATPASGWQFDSWSGGYTGTTATVVMDADKSITANFSQITASVQTITIQEGEDGFCSVDGTVDSNNAGFTGSGFSNTANATGNGIDYSVDALAGTATLVIRFANGSTDRPANIIVNGSTQVSSLNMASTGSWISWADVTTTITLANGVNTIRLEATASGGLANIDYIEVTASNAVGVSCLTGNLRVLDAEDEMATSSFDISIYPNPTANSLNIRTGKAEAEVKVFDLTGKLIRDFGKRHLEEPISVADLPQGTYIINVISGEEAYRLPFIKQ